MKKILHIVAKIVLSLILIAPVLGTLGIFPPPTRELYNTDIAFEFILLITEAGYITWIMLVVHTLAIIALWTRREALAALLLSPITINIIGFHIFLDGGLFTAGAIMANMLVLLNGYLLWKNRKQYEHLWMKNRKIDV